MTLRNFIIASMWFMWLNATTSFAQGIVGASTVITGQTVTYSYDEGALLSAARWVVTNGVKGTTTRVGTTYSQTVTWSTAGTGSIRLEAKETGHGDYYVVASKSISVLSAPPTPNATFTGPSYLCNSTSVTRSAPPTGAIYDWYWQTSPTGTDVSTTAANATRTITTSTPLYLRAKFKSNSTWSANPQQVLSGPITVYSTPSKPSSAANGYRFGPGQLTLSVATVPNSTEYKWYTGDTPTTTFIDGQTTNTYAATFSSNTTYYVSTINGPCESSSRTPVSATIFDKPVISMTNGGTIQLGSSVVLSTATYDSYKWLYANGTIAGTASTLNVTSPGWYILAVTKNGVTGQSDPVYIKHYLDLKNRNYIYTVDPLVKESDVNKVHGLAADKAHREVKYFDGTGKLEQSIIVAGTPTMKDFVTMSVYDNIGREFRKLVPFAHTESNGVYKERSSILSASDEYIGIPSDFFGESQGEIPFDTKPYADLIFESAAGGRVLKQGGVGEMLQPQTTASLDRSVKLSYETNNANEVYIWSWNQTDRTADARIGTSFNYYPAGSLIVKIRKDASNKSIVEYYNKFGDIIAKKLALKDVPTANDFAWTYFVYNDFGNMVLAITPEAVANLTTQYFNLTDKPSKQAYLGKWCYIYRYDSKNRCVVTKEPGIDSMYIVYNDRDQMIMSQDGNQRSKKEWMYYKYDALSRPIMKGVYIHASVYSQIEMQQHALSYITDATLVYETYDGSTSNHGYTNRVFPTQGNQLWEVCYYDDYKFLLLSDYTTLTFLQTELAGMANKSVYVPNQVTGGKSIALQTNVWLPSARYYDRSNRLIQIVQKNNGNGLTRSSTIYNFRGQFQKTKVSHTAFSEPAISIVKDFSYDHGGRVSYVTSSINGSASIILYKNRYNELGSLVEVGLHSVNGGASFLQSNDYRYNIQGWRTKMNGLPDDESSDLFSYELRYNNPANSSSEAKYNGVISEVQWKSVGNNSQLYSYKYDYLDRLIEAKYFDLKNPLKDSRYNINIGSATKKAYDLNGNILFEERNGDLGNNTFGPMDQLTYDYASSGNQLTKVTDALPISTNEIGFKDNNKTGNDYDYDLNGNMVRDLNKGISLMSFNPLNLLAELKTAEGTIKYNYSSGGEKLCQEVYSSTNQLVKKTDYVGQFVYEGQKLSYLVDDKGRILPIRDASGNITGYEYEYFLKDKLGNVRVAFTSRNQSTSFLATMEVEPPSLKGHEENTFNLANSTRSATSWYNHTPQDNSGYVRDRSLLLRGKSSYVNELIGAAKSLEVNPGEIFDIEVYSKYTDPQVTASDVDEIFASLVSAFSLKNTPGSTGIDGAQAHNAFNELFGPGPFIGRGPEYEDVLAPKAYLNYILFDENFVLQDFGFDQISIAANEDGTNVAHDYLNLHIKIKVKGYLYVYVSNENPELIPVYFDDLKITRNTNVTQTNDYYPSGLTFNTYQKPNGTAQPLKFLSREEQDELGVNLIDLMARMYQPEIGRFISADSKAGKFMALSPYSYSANSPTNLTDPNGEEWILTITRDKNGKITHVHFRFTGVIYNSSKRSMYQIYQFKDVLKSQMEAAFTGEENGLSVSIDVNLRVATRLDQINEFDHIIEIVDDDHPVLKTWNQGAGDGLTPFGGLRTYFSLSKFDAMVAYTPRNDPDYKTNDGRSGVHEMGHTLGWHHPEDRGLEGVDRREGMITTRGDDSYNMMFSWPISKNACKVNPNHAIRWVYDQIIIAVENYENGDLNRQDNFAYKYFPSSTFPYYMKILDKSKLLYPKR